MKTVSTIAFFLLAISHAFPVFSQFVSLEGYVFASNNTGLLNEVKITVLGSNNALIGETTTDIEGVFSMDLLPGKDYMIRANKPGFTETTIAWSSIGKEAGEKEFLKLPMDRAPGYILEVTMAELIESEDVEESDAIVGATIEIYNNTKKEEALVLKDYESHLFSFTLEQGNSYTAMIRKKGFYTKRMEIDVAVDGCILCMDGFGEINPGVSENLTQGNVSGTLGANVNLQKIVVGKGIVLNNIYYDLGKADIRSDAAIELDRIVGVLNDNQHLIVELSSHTDSRGDFDDNQELSEKRAQSAVNYLVGQGVDRTRMAHKGHGESKLRNNCGDDVKCSERRHQENRRTEFTVIGFTEEDPYEHYSLKRIIEEERLMEEIMNLDQTIIQIKAGEKPPSNDNPPEKMEDKGEEPGKLIEEKPSNPTLLNDLTGGTETENLEDAPVEEQIIEQINISESQNVEPEIKEPLLPEITTPYIGNDYSGFKIQVLSSSLALSPDHRLFREFEDLIVDQSGPNRYHYLIGDFENGKDALNFMETNISQTFPNATVVQFVNGKRQD